jgi:hypothetical protein
LAHNKQECRKINKNIYTKIYTKNIYKNIGQHTCRKINKNIGAAKYIYTKTLVNIPLVREDR